MSELVQPSPVPGNVRGGICASLDFPVVGIGASAGGLQALQHFFEHMPENIGMAFVVILHLSPKHQSSAAEILQRVTKIPVVTVNNPTIIEKNHVYIIPPGKQLSISDGYLRVSALDRPLGQHVAIDFFSARWQQRTASGQSASCCPAQAPTVRSGCRGRKSRAASPLRRSRRMRNTTACRELPKDMLIGVTNFFWDRESFEALERDVIPQLFKDKKPGDQVRVWVTACSTGEEAYSIAMLLGDQESRMEKPPEVQVFATDIDDEAIAIARRGSYPHSIDSDIPAPKLREYFVKDASCYRIKKALRDYVLFASHNLLRDPPFSKLDLITCRNLLIYLNREMQSQVLEMFHFALNPGGFLFLGSSESAEAASHLFTPVDKKNRVYRAKALSRVKTGKLTLSMSDVDLSALVNSIVSVIQADPAAAELKIEVLAPQAPLVIRADLVRVEQVVLNLLNNAVKFTQPGGRITVRLSQEGSTARLDVIDDGKGMSPEFVPSSFDMFGQAAPVTTRSKGGLGIGLALVRQITELHGGRVEAASEGLGKGSRFSVWLPLYGELLVAPPEQDGTAKGSIAGLRLLLVDDTVDLITSFKILLELEGAVVYTATSAVDALKILDTHDVDLVVSDISMPEMDGHMFIREVRKKAKFAQLPAIALSGLARAQDIARAREAGFSAYLSKPVSLPRLIGTVKDLRLQ